MCFFSSTTYLLFYITKIIIIIPPLLFGARSRPRQSFAGVTRDVNALQVDNAEGEYTAGIMGNTGAVVSGNTETQSVGFV